jgi:hypothetical protein
VSVLQVVRFFVVVPLVPNAMLAAFAAVTVAGCTAIALDAAYALRTMPPVMLLQLFAAASGFRVPARRGHYDLLVTGGANRTAIALVHWFMSVLPGVLAWLVLAAVAHVAGSDALVASGTLAAMLVVSTIPWSLTMPLPRLSGAIVFLLLFVTVTTAGSPEGTPEIGMVLPWVFVGVRLGPTQMALAVLFAGIAVAAATVAIRLMDFPLESGQ